MKAWWDSFYYEIWE